MTGGSGATPPPVSLPAGVSSRRIAWMVLRIAGSITALMALYYWLPLDHSSLAVAITILVIGLVGFIALVALQVSTIIRSRYPGLRAAECLATSVPFFLLLFSATYVVLAALSKRNFGAPLTHTDSLYFTVTVFATVGFGDITAKSEVARLVVTGQMIADLVVLGLAVRVIVGAVRRSHARTAPQAASQAPQAPQEAPPTPQEGDDPGPRTTR